MTIRGAANGFCSLRYCTNCIRPCDVGLSNSEMSVCKTKQGLVSLVSMSSYHMWFWMLIFWHFASV